MTKTNRCNKMGSASIYVNFMTLFDLFENIFDGLDQIGGDQIPIDVFPPPDVCSDIPSRFLDVHFDWT